MFEWLAYEMSKVNTRKFFVVTPLTPHNRKVLAQVELALPPSYHHFMLEFGEAKLYRIGDSYRVQVFALPRIEENEGAQRVCIGRTEDTLAYFKTELLKKDCESPIFEWHYPRRIEQRKGESFEEWLRKHCARVRKYYTKNEWRAIEEGPPAFDASEKRIIEARRLFRWDIVGIADNGDVEFQVYNGSNLVLPYLSIGIRGKMRHIDDTLEGGVWLPIASVLPGHSAVIAKDCYKNVVDPKDVVAFAEPDPEPEDRDRYWEFRPLPK